MTSTCVYSLCDFGTMIADAVRVNAYVAAIERAVTPGCTVLDIGTGTGYFALLAARLGAGRVYAIEPNDAVQVAREIAAANGLAERITFVQELSTRFSLPEPAQVVVSDLRGVLPLFGRHIPTLADARRRLLAPGGTLIPRQDTIWGAVVEKAALYEQFVAPWTTHARDLDMSAARRRATSGWCKARIEADDRLTAPLCWAAIDYASAECPDVGGELSWTVDRAGMAHGIALWFDTELKEGIGFSNAPGAPRAIYGQAFFPFADAVQVAPGDRIHVALDARLVGDEYLWSWNTTVLPPGRDARPGARFRQSSFLGSVLSLDTLRKRADGHVPVLAEDGRIERFILSEMDGATTVGEIARRVQREFPHRFARWEAAVSRVGDCSARYGAPPAPAGAALG